jgi:DnaD/phage-associated family protein
MTRIRAVKPEFFRHEGLQTLEIEYPTLYPMLVFEGIWLQCDKLGHFQWKPSQLHLDILPFIKFNIEHTLYILEAHGFLKRYMVDDKLYGEVSTFTEHQRITGSEKQNDARFPTPKDYLNGITKETLRQQQGNNPHEWESIRNQQGNTEDYGKGEGGGEGNGYIRKGVVDKLPATAEIFILFEDNYQKLNQGLRDTLCDFIDTYSEEKVLHAINEGIKYNKRNLAYIEAILKEKGNGFKPKTQSHRGTPYEDINKALDEKGW